MLPLSQITTSEIARPIKPPGVSDDELRQIEIEISKLIQEEFD